ncbi:hypothetical protein Tco_1322530, partial [Tanacetum coccineum]
KDHQFRTNSDDDEESYATEFTDSMFNDDVDDSGNKIETRKIEEKVVEKEKEDVEIEKEKNDDTNVKKIDEVVKKKDDTDVMSVQEETKKEKMQTPIPSPTRSPRNISSSDKTISEELTAVVSPTTATTSKTSMSKCKEKSFRQKTKTLTGIVLELTVAKTNEMIKKEMPRLVKLAINKDREISPVDISDMVSKQFEAYGLRLIKELF